jgi:hypothetical protein
VEHSEKSEAGGTLVTLADGRSGEAQGKMSSAFTAPVRVGVDGSSVVLERVPLTGPDSSALYSEVWLQDLVYRHPRALPIAEIHDSFSGAVPVCREMQTPAGPIDVVYVTPTGRPVIVEAKLWRNPEARRKVIAQVLDYAKELSRWSYDTFDAAVRQARRKEDGANPKGLSEVLGYEPISSESQVLHERVSQSLSRGDLLLLIVGDGIREGVGGITVFLEGHASLHFTFGLVEMAIFRLADGGHLVQPRILAQSAIVRRIVVELRSEGLTATEDTSVGEELPGGTSNRTSPDRLRAFWSLLLKQLKLDNQSQLVRSPSGTPNQSFPMPEGSEAWVSAYLHQSRQRAGVFLTFRPGPVADRIFAALTEDRADIERELGVPVEWESDGRKHWIVSYETFSDSLIDAHETEILAMLSDRLNRYINTFRPRLDRILRETP